MFFCFGVFIIYFVIVSISHENIFPIPHRLRNVSEAISKVKKIHKELFIERCTSYVTKKSPLITKPFLIIENVPWRERLLHPKIKEFYSEELFSDFLKTVFNISEGELIGLCDDIVIYLNGFNLIQFKNTKSNFGVVAFLDISNYKTFLLSERNKDWVYFIHTYIFIVGILIMTMNFVLFGTIVFYKPFLRKLN